MKIIASVLIVLSLVAAIAPQFLDCQSQGKSLTLQNGKTVPMKCHWTAISMIAVGGPLFLLGGLLFFSKRKETQRTLSALGSVSGAFMVAMPTFLIGVCANPDMLCNSVMKPTLILTGILAIIAGGGGVLLAWRDEPRQPIAQPA